ncbi:5-oxoproline transporter, DUF969 family subunit, partial [Clostridioides difficile]
LGIQLPLASWGNMLQDAQRHIFDKLYLAVFPGLLIFLTVMSLPVSLIEKLKRLTTGKVLTIYMIARQIAGALSIRMSGHPQFVRP